MTPFAQAILNDCARPVKDRQFADGGHSLASKLLEAHCFDITAVNSAVISMTTRLVNDNRSFGEEGSRSIIGKMAFLPAETVWIEARGSTGHRLGFLVTIDGENATFMLADQEKFGASANFYPLYLGDAQRLTSVGNFSGKNSRLGFAYSAIVYCALAMINTPRVIGRKQHMPHAGLQRKLAAAQGMVGKFPLRAWTELVLEVTVPRVGGERSHETRLTGGKALHFCRAHLRLQNGCLVLVSPHWRGDPALGIKQTQYSVIPPRDGKWPKSVSNTATGGSEFL